MNLLLPTTANCLALPCGYELDFTAITGKGVGFECFLLPPDGGMASGDGATAADAFLSMLSDDHLEDAAFPVAVAAALDELGHQAVRIVCHRLAGGHLESAVFAPPVPLDLPAGPEDDAPQACNQLVPCEQCPEPFQCRMQMCSQPDADTCDTERLRSAP